MLQNGTNVQAAAYCSTKFYSPAVILRHYADNQQTDTSENLIGGGRSLRIRQILSFVIQPPINAVCMQDGIVAGHTHRLKKSAFFDI